MKTESVNEMIKNFHSMWENGKSIREISEFYGIHITTTYKYLEEVAKNNNVATRLYYLEAPNKSHPGQRRNNDKVKKQTDCSVEEMLESFENLLNSIKQVEDSIEKIIKEDNNNIN